VDLSLIFFIVLLFFFLRLEQRNQQRNSWEIHGREWHFLQYVWDNPKYSWFCSKFIRNKQQVKNWKKQTSTTGISIVVYRFLSEDSQQQFVPIVHYLMGRPISNRELFLLKRQLFCSFLICSKSSKIWMPITLAYVFFGKVMLTGLPAAPCFLYFPYLAKYLIFVPYLNSLSGAYQSFRESSFTLTHRILYVICLFDLSRLSAFLHYHTEMHIQGEDSL